MSENNGFKTRVVREIGGKIADGEKREKPHRAGREHENHRSKRPEWARTEWNVGPVAEFALTFIPKHSGCTVEEVFSEYTGRSVQPSLPQVSSVCRALYEWAAVGLVHDPDTAQGNVEHATEVFRFLFNQEGGSQACIAFFWRVSELEDQDHDATLARSVMAAAFVAQAPRNKELEQLVFELWGEDAGSWSEYVGEPVRGLWFKWSRQSEFDKSDVDGWADSYGVPKQLREAVSNLARPHNGCTGGSVVDLAFDLDGGIPAMYAWVARSLGGMGVCRWDTSMVILGQLLTTEDFVEEGMLFFQKELAALRIEGRRAVVRSLMRAVLIQQRAGRLTAIAQKALRLYLGPTGRWQGHLTLNLKRDAVEIFGTSCH